jgi:hypothetical protein
MVPGMEEAALALIANVAGFAAKAASIATFLQDLQNYRTRWFGDPLETAVQPAPQGGTCPEALDKFRCLASWTEILPTDGTHLEVVQASTSADDIISDQQLADLHALREAESSGIKNLSQKAANVEFKLSLPDGTCLPLPPSTTGG